MKLAIIVDSTAYLPENLIQHPDVYTVYLTSHFADGEDVLDSAAPEDQTAFYQKLVTQEELPTTSQPSPEDYYQVLEDLVAQGYDTVFCIHLSSAISGTYQSAHLYTQDFEDRLDIHIIDSKAASVVMEMLVQTTLNLSNSHYSASQIHTALDWLTDNSTVYLLVEDLNNLAKGGRLSTGSALLGSMLKIRPLLYFDDQGQIVLYEKLRTNKRVYRLWLDLIQEALDTYPQGLSIGLANADCPDDMLEIIDLIRGHYPQLDIHSGQLGPVVGTHTGRNSKGIGILPKLPDDFFEKNKKQ